MTMTSCSACGWRDGIGGARGCIYTGSGLLC